MGFLILILPSFGVFLFCLKFIGVFLINRRTNDKNLDRVTQITGTIFSLIMLIFSGSFLVFWLLFLLFPSALDRIPVIFLMLGFVGIVVFYCCAAGFIQGLGQATGVSGVPARTILTELYQAFSKKPGSSHRT